MNSHWLVLGPALVTTLQPIIYNGSFWYLVQPLTLVGTGTLLIMGSLSYFQGSCGTLNFYEHWLGPNLLPLKVSWFVPFYRPNNLWMLFIFGTAVDLSWSMSSIDHGVSLWHLENSKFLIPSRVTNLLLGLGRPMVHVLWTVLWIKGHENLVILLAFEELTHCGLVMPNGNINLGQHWLR